MKPTSLKPGMKIPQPKNYLPEAVAVGLLLVMGVVALLPATPWLYPTLDTDTSIFMYMGEKILEGKLPFRDVYDHKPPLIFYLDALGLWIGSGSRWGIWVIEVISLSAASLLGFVFLRRYFRTFAAMVGVGTLLVNLAFVHQRGNLTEEYALPFQFGAFFFLSELDRTGKAGWRAFAIGCMLAMASTLKQPLAGVGVSIVFFLILYYGISKRWKELLAALFWIGLGALAVWGAWFAYFTVIGVLPEFWEAAFSHNFAISSIPLEQRGNAVLSAFQLLFGFSTFFSAGMLVWLAVSPYLILRDERLSRLLLNPVVGFGLVITSLLILWSGSFQSTIWHSEVRVLLITSGLLLLIAAFFVFSGRARRAVSRIREKWNISGNSPIFLPLIIAVVDLPVELLLSSLSGSNYAHYFMPLLPSLAILAAYGAYALYPLFLPFSGKAAAYAWIVALAVPLYAQGVNETLHHMGPRGDRQVEQIAAYIEANSLPDDYVYQWGIVPSVHLMTGRDSPTRYFVPVHLFVDGYSGKKQTNQLLGDFQENPPVLIIDAGIPRLPLLTTPDLDRCETVKDPQVYEQFVNDWQDKVEYNMPQMPEGMDDIYYWICENYVPVGPVGELAWQVYRWKGQ